jgi:hypothetical protein
MLNGVAFEHIVILENIMKTNKRPPAIPNIYKHGFLKTRKEMDEDPEIQKMLRDKGEDYQSDIQAASGGLCQTPVE